jgi:hypothetical protein
MYVAYRRRGMKRRARAAVRLRLRLIAEKELRDANRGGSPSDLLFRRLSDVDVLKDGWDRF